MSRQGVKPVFGGGAYGFGYFTTDEEMIESFDVLLAGGCNTIDTARTYGNAEQRMGETKAGNRLIIDTKSPGGLVKGECSAEKIVQHAEESLKTMGIQQLDIYYLHAPDSAVPMREICSGFNTAYEKGYFRRFGISNFTAEQIREAYDIATKEGWIVPSVYQGNYNPVARLQETEILPLLRELNIAFYAYSPLGGGFLTKSLEQMTSGSDAGRFSKGSPLAGLYGGMYGKPSMLKALGLWEKAAEKAGVSRAELAYRWIAFDSALDPAKGDAVIFGAGTVARTKETLSFFEKGPIGNAALADVNHVWEMVKGEATLNNIDRNGDPVF